jgi:hypothetical protein
MQKKARHGNDRRRGRGVFGLVVLAAIVVLLMAGLTACGSTSIAGDYKFDSGSEEGMEAFMLTLNDDDTFVLSQPATEGSEEISINGTYALDGDKITLTVKDGDESEVGTVEGDKLVFETITWIKQ